MRGIHDTVPATRWEDAFPVGNGRHGALVYGDPQAETVIMTHHHLTWPTPEAVPAAAAGVPPDLAGRLGVARDLLLAGESRPALELLTGDWPQYWPRPFHPAFAVRLSDLGSGARGSRGLPHADDGYLRTLNYRTGVAAATWPGLTGVWQSFCFASRARDVVVQCLTAPPRAELDLTVEVDVGLPCAPTGLLVSGRVREQAPGDVLIVTSVRYPDPGPGGYIGVTRMVTAGGDGFRLPSRPRALRVHGAGELLLMTRVAAFAGAADADAALDAAIAAVAGLPASRRDLIAEHARLHAAEYRSVRLDLGAPPDEQALSAAELLRQQAAQPDEPLPALLEKLFDSGRYLLMSASGLLPPRLTGLWQGDWNPAWSGAVTTNANLGLQLAGAVTTDVPAAITALTEHVRDRLPHWQLNARRLFGCRGIAVPAQSDGLDGRCSHFSRDWPHQLWTAGADWLLAPLLDAADANGDEPLRARLRPALRELALFYEDFLTRTEDGHVVFVPSYSPENAPPGWSPAAVNATMDIAAARHALLAAAASGAGDASDTGRWLALAARLPPYRINPDGALAEWAWPPAGSGQPPLPENYDHRHVSHLYPVWPLHEITTAGTPELAAAALRALHLRGAQDDSAHGYLHKTLAAARLRDTRLAGQLLAALTGRRFFFRSLMSSHYPDQHVYNADAACALPGLLAELLVDSAAPVAGRPGWIELLPAVPDYLPSGRLRGVRTLTGVLVTDLRWDLDGGQAHVTLVSRADQEIDLSCRELGRQRVFLPAARPFRASYEW